MTIDIKCVVCKNADRRKAIELSWNGGMAAETIARLFEGVPAAAILRHLKRHTDGVAAIRQIEVAVTPARERVLAIQQMQLNEVERRIELAMDRADMLNAQIDKMVELGQEGAEEVPHHDWSEFYDILGKDAQAAIGSILKVQGLSDKREKATSELKLGLFEAMAKAGLAPRAISGGSQSAIPALQSEDEDLG